MTAQNDELREYRESIRSFLNSAPAAELPAVVDNDLWKRLAIELGAAGLLVPEEHGGAGASLAVAMQVLGELAASTVSLPYLSTAVLAPSALLECPQSESRSRYLEAIAGGEILAAVVLGDVMPDAAAPVTARMTEGVWRLTGAVDIVLETTGAGLLLVVAETDAGSTALFSVAGSGVTTTPLPALDLTRSVSRVEFDSAAAELLSDDFAAGRRRLFEIACAAMSVEMAEAAGAALDMAVDYAKVRSQFGTLIGSQQLVQKLCADMFVVVTSARAAASAACAAVMERSSESGRLTAIAKAYTSERAPGVGESNVQVHGGIGFTWEHPAHIYLRRIRSAAQLFGDAKFHRRSLGRQLQLIGGGA